jgi:hypothetical protein
MGPRGLGDDSEMAPQAVEIAQNGLGNGKAPEAAGPLATARPRSPGQVDDATHEVAGVRALADVDFKPAGLQDAVEALADE